MIDVCQLIHMQLDLVLGFNTLFTTTLLAILAKLFYFLLCLLKQPDNFTLFCELDLLVFGLELEGFLLLFGLFLEFFQFLSLLFDDVLGDALSVQESLQVANLLLQGWLLRFLLPNVVSVELT